MCAYKMLTIASDYAKKLTCFALLSLHQVHCPVLWIQSACFFLCIVIFSFCQRLHCTPQRFDIIISVSDLFLEQYKEEDPHPLEGHHDGEDVGKR